MQESQLNPTSQLNALLTGLGIQPLSFAFFLTEFIKDKRVKKHSELSSLITSQLKAQAELITYYINHQAP